MCLSEYQYHSSWAYTAGKGGLCLLTQLEEAACSMYLTFSVKKQLF